MLVPPQRRKIMTAGQTNCKRKLHRIAFVFSCFRHHCPLCSAKNRQEFTNKLSPRARSRPTPPPTTWARSSWPGPSWWGAGARGAQPGAAAGRPAWIRDVCQRVWVEAGGRGRRTAAWWHGRRRGRCSLNTWRCTRRRPGLPSASPGCCPGDHKVNKSHLV